MIVDSSAIVALLLNEAEAPLFSALLIAAPRRSVSAGTWIELSVVITRRFEPAMFDLLDVLMAKYDIAIVPVSPEQARIGRQAYREYGRGSDPRAKLNFGDCFAYALAMETGEPLLFKGEDFIHTDVKQAAPR